MLSRLCWIGLACSLLHAAPAFAEPIVCDGAIDGHVVDAATHEPIAGATVQVGATTMLLTDEAGRFSAEGLCAESVGVTAERADYQRGELYVALHPRASVELELSLAGDEVIEIHDRTPPPTELRAVTTLSGETLERTRGESFSKALSSVPGVAQLGSSSGLAKPIIRGQFGRRLLVLVDGLRHASQDWGVDHAPEVDPFVASSLSVVRGAAGVRYGPDAIGGAIIAEPAPLPETPGTSGEAHVVGLANGRGGSAAARVQGALASVEGLAWQGFAAGKRTAAAETPDYALDNTATREWSVGATVGYRSGVGEYRLSAMHYDQKLGVCSCLRVDSIEDFMATLGRDRPLGSESFSSDFEIERGYQATTHDTVLARAHWKLHGVGDVTATYGFQSDHRREYDVVRKAVTGPQYSFQLATHDVDVAVEHDPIHISDHLHLRGSAGVLGRVQNHAYAGLPLIPDYRAYSGGAYVAERLVGHDFELELGARYDTLARDASLERLDYLRLVRSGQLAEEACAGGDLVECESTFHLFSVTAGALVKPADALTLKLEVSSSARPPNADEQYLNGTAPTFPVLGLGKPDLGAERTYAGSVTGTWRSDRVWAELSTYANRIDDYIYFAPAIGEDGQPIFDVTIRGAFPRFTTRPVDALFYGADGGVSVEPTPGLTVGGQLAVVRAKNRTDDSYLVFVPADRARGFVTVKRAMGDDFTNTYATLTADYAARQRRFDPAADLARPPAAYVLLGAELGTTISIGERPLNLALTGSNLANRRYRDYTSVLRYFADQPGMQLALRLSTRF